MLTEAQKRARRKYYHKVTKHDEKAKVKRKEAFARWKEKNKDFHLDYVRTYRQKRKDGQLKFQQPKEFNTHDWARQALKNIKARAKRRGIVCTITINHIQVPEVCPVLGIKIEIGGNNVETRPSVDRKDNTKGYVPDNIHVISSRANRLKSDSSVEELEKILKYVKTT